MPLSLDSVRSLATASLSGSQNVRWAQYLLKGNGIPEIAMKKLLSFKFFERKSPSVAPFPGRLQRKKFFLAGVRCPSDQFQIVAIHLPFVQRESNPIF